jgi:hypothetical protein
MLSTAITVVAAGTCAPMARPARIASVFPQAAAQAKDSTAPNFNFCGQSECVCFTSSSGSVQCVNAGGCDVNCGQDSDCPGGICAVNTCCGSPTCQYYDPCVNAASPSRLFRLRSIKREATLPPSIDPNTLTNVQSSG